MKIPKTIKDIEKMVKDEVPESLHLDYKASQALIKKKKDEICKDVSSFANADGGILIYGVKEKGNIPYEIDQGALNNEIDREWIDQILSYNISPPLDGLKIVQIKKDECHSFYVLNIPKSYRGPHQAPDKRYYKRFNFRSAPMEHYEIEDIKNRNLIIPPLIDIKFETENVLFKLIIENIGTEVAQNVIFEFSPEFKWPKKSLPPALSQRIKYFQPGRKLTYTYSSSIEALKKDSKISTVFDLNVRYNHPRIGREIQDTFHFDLNDYFGTRVERDPLKEMAKSLEQIAGLKGVLEEHNRYMKELGSIASPTGLDFSITSLRNLRHLLSKDDSFEPLDIRHCDLEAMQEILGIDGKLTYRIYEHIHFGESNQSLNDLEGMTDDILNKIKKNFKI